MIILYVIVTHPPVLRVSLTFYHVLGANLKEAEKLCNGLGENWKITRKTKGSAVCSTVPHYENCHGCESWRLLVWEDGACDKLLSNRCRFNNTESGNYYCGYEPCKDGDLKYGGIWFP